MKYKNIIRKIIAGIMVAAFVVATPGGAYGGSVSVEAKEKENEDKQTIIKEVTFLENNKILNKFTDSLHFQFTLEKVPEDGVVTLGIDMTDDNTELCMYTDMIEPVADKENTYMATFMFPFEDYNGACEISAIYVDDAVYECAYTFEFESEQCDYFKINSISYAEDFDGVVTLTDEEDEQWVTLDIDYEVTKELTKAVRLYLYLVKKNEYGEIVDYIERNLYYYPETKTLKNSFYITYDDDKLVPGEYVLDTVKIDGKYKYNLSKEEELPLSIVIASDDICGPQLNDLYITIDGEVCDEYPARFEQGQEVRVWADLSDNTAGIRDVSIALKGYDEDRGYGNYGWNMLYDEETGLYYYDIIYDNEFGEMVLYEIEAYDRYNNCTRVSEVNGVPFDFIYVYYNDESSLIKYDYTVSVDNYLEVTKKEITTKRITSFEEMGLDNMTPPEIEGAEFLGWETNNGTFITDSKEKFAVDGEDIVIKPVYDKRVVNVYARYRDENNKVQDARLAYAINDDTTYVGLKERVLKGKKLDEIKHNSELIFEGWEFDVNYSGGIVDAEAPKVMFRAQYTTPAPIATEQPIVTIQPVATAQPAVTLQTVTESKGADKRLKSPELKSAKSSKKKFVVKWSKVKDASGYEIVYSSDKTMKKNKKTTTISGKSKQKITLNRVKGKKKCYVKIRAYKVVNGKKQYSVWSKIKKY